MSAHRGIVQVAYAVDDVDAAAEHFASTWGAGPFVIARHIELASVLHAGVSASFDHSSAYGQWGDVMVELVQVHEASPASLADAVVRRGGGLHHVARFVDGLDTASTAEAASGHPLVLDATSAAGVRFRFHDARHDLGHLVELYEPVPALVAFFAHVAATTR